MPYPRILSSSGKDIKTYQFDHDMYGGPSFDKQRLVAVGSLKYLQSTNLYPILTYFEGDPLEYKYTLQLDNLVGQNFY